MKFRRKLLLFYCLLFAVAVRGQNTIGLPAIINYSKHIYNGGTQSWDIQQNDAGVLFFANNEGLLSFDGSRWRIYPLPNKTIIRSVAIAPDKRIYVGGQGEIGFFAAGNDGDLHYTSLLNLIQPQDCSFDDVWDIKIYKGDIFFRSNSKIFQLSNNSIITYSDKEWTFLGQCSGRLFAQNSQYQLCFFKNGKWVSFNTKNILPANSWITAAIDLTKDKALIVTQLAGLYLLTGDSLSKLQSPAIDQISAQHIYAACLAGNQNIALGTSQHGVYIINSSGELIQSLADKDGVQNNNILSVFLDKEQNIWLGTDNGIDMVAYNNAIRHIYIPGHSEAAGYTAALYNNKLYIGTSNGLYSTVINDKQDISYAKSGIEPVANTQGQVWNLSVVNGKLLMGHNDGAFVINGQTAQRFSDTKGFWNFQPYNYSSSDSSIVAGTYGGLSFFNDGKTSFTPANLTIPFESSRFVTIAANHKIWMAHPYKGLYCITIKEGAAPAMKLYSAAEGVRSLNFVFTLNNKILAATDNGILELSPSKNVFVPSAYYNQLFGNIGIRYVRQDAAGNIWFVAGKRVGVVDNSGPKPEIFYIQELDNKIVSGYEFIYPFNSENILVGGEKGLFHINYNLYKRKSLPPVVQVRLVKSVGIKDSLLFGGYANAGKNKTPEVRYKSNSLHFEYSVASYTDAGNLQYSYLLDGFDKSWSEWTTKTEKDYTNLPSGKYSFLIKARNNLGEESTVSRYTFSILPPWYRTNLAYVLYAILFIGFNYAFYRWIKTKFRKQRQAHEEEQKRQLYLYQLETDKQEKEIVKLKNEKLEAEIALKNAELASTTLHLIKKGDLLSKMKEDLTRQMKNDADSSSSLDLKKIVKAIGEDEKIDKDWENFSTYFDKTHGDFLKMLKEKHPKLTPGDLKLCTYLRLNLASKDIAPLMNISLRSVELNRYRLRKKLEIPTEKNLFDYLIQIKPVNTNPESTQLN
jgi:ligand-binding sensor domain-containing protein